MTESAKSIAEIIVDKRDVLETIFGHGYEKKPLEDLLADCYFLACERIKKMSRLLASYQEEEGLNTSFYNSNFAISFIIISPPFQHFTYALRFKKGDKNTVSEIEYMIHLLQMYLRFASELSENIKIPLSDIVSLEDLGNQLITHNGGLWPYTFCAFNLLNDGEEIKKSFGSFVDEMQNKMREKLDGIESIFSFPSPKAKALSCYKRWIAAFDAYLMFECNVELKERIKPIMQEIIIGDKKGADYGRRKLAEKLIKFSLLRKPLSSAHSS